jgi:Flp pilus assembly protein protease CpaA
VILISVIVAALGLLIASITDIKTREVPDLVSHGMIFAGIGIGAIYSAASQSWMPLAYAGTGFGLGFLVGVLMFYTGQWGGGDSKIVMGLGALLGASVWNLGQFDFITFLLDSLLVGSVYGVGYSVLLALRAPKRFLARLRETASEKKIILYRRIIIVFAAAGLLAAFLVPQDYRLVVFSFTAVVYLFFYLILAVRVVEKEFMIRETSPDVLTEGDWIAREVHVGKRYIAGPKDLGVSREQIALLKKLHKQRKISTVLLKEGIPFVPSFLIAFVLMLIFGNWLLLFML